MKHLTPREKIRYIKRRELELSEYARKALDPHFGYLSFICKFINNHQITHEYQIDHLITNLNKKNVIKSLPKGLQTYQSLHTLCSDINKNSRRLKAIRFISDNVASSSRPFFLSIIDDDGLIEFRDHRIINDIINDRFKSDLFKRWSSRIKSKSDAISYTKDIHEGSKYLDLKNNLEGVVKINGYDVYQMDDFEKFNKIMPVSWCMKNQESTFERYKSDYSIMYMVIDKGGKVFGVNFPRKGYPEIQDQNNQRVFGEKYSELTRLFDPTNWKDVKTGNHIPFYLKLKTWFARNILKGI